MTRAAERSSYPWHDGPHPAGGVDAVRASVRGRRAGVVTRCLANVVDAAVVLLVLAGGYAVFAASRFLLSPTSFRFPAPSLSLLIMVGLGVLAVYFAVTWAVVGSTYGDRLLGLRVADDEGGRLGWGRACARAVLCTVFLPGLLWVLLSKENRSVQDLVVRSSVIYD
ncbi:MULTISPECIES: RDD family protein [unclassified Geodermatophilus]|uniref:RDD family protein n=1 Tax=unclassified Geodermatophilus TaxID=2637632 RepID=UPI003EE96F74